MVASHKRDLRGLEIFQAVGGSQHPIAVNDNGAAHMHVPKSFLSYLPRELVCHYKGKTLFMDIIMPCFFFFCGKLHLCYLIIIGLKESLLGRTGGRETYSRLNALVPPTILTRLGKALPRMPHPTSLFSDIILGKIHHINLMFAFAIAPH